MKIEETFSVAAPIARVWQFITDPEQVAPCVPGCQSYEVVGPKAYKATIKVAVGPIKTTFNVTVELTTEEVPTFLASTTRGDEGSRASTLTAHNELRLVATDDQTTEVSYLSEISLVGRLGKFGLGMMKKKAKQLGGEFAEEFRTRVEMAPSAETGGDTGEPASEGTTGETSVAISPAGNS